MHIQFSFFPFALSYIIIITLVNTPDCRQAKSPQQRESLTFGAAQRPVKNNLDIIEGFKNIFVEVANTVTPSVVAVIPVKVDTTSQNPYQFYDNNNSPFDYNPDSDKNQKPDQNQNEKRSEVLGSGVIVSSDGYILTNNHVIEDATEITVQLWNGNIYDASLVGTDSLSDVAVIKMEGEFSNLPAAYLGNSDSLKRGDWVAAIGNPFNFLSSVTQGIVSALERQVADIVMYQNFIQTDAAINPGNSGGALVNIYGEVVGINTMIYSQTGGFMGIGFAIPINMAKRVMEDLIYEGRVCRGWIGISIQDLTPVARKALDLKITDGVLVCDVFQNEPADNAGIKRGDVIVEINGQKIETGNDLKNRVALFRPDSSIPVTFLREGKSCKTIVKVLERSNNLIPEQKFKQTPAFSDADNITGISVSNLDTEIRKKYNIFSGTKGVIVTAIEASITDERAAILPGDVIISVKIKNKKTRSITSLKDFFKFTKELGNHIPVLMLIQRGNCTFFIPFEIKNQVSEK